MGLSRFFHKAAQGVSRVFGKVGGVVKKVADFAAPVIKKVGEYARPVADTVSAVALAFGQPEIAAAAQAVGRGVEKGAKKLEPWSNVAHTAVDAFGNRTAAKINKVGAKVQADAQNKRTLHDFIE